MANEKNGKRLEHIINLDQENYNHTKYYFIHLCAQWGEQSGFPPLQMIGQDADLLIFFVGDNGTIFAN